MVRISIDCPLCGDGGITYDASIVDVGVDRRELGAELEIVNRTCDCELSRREWRQVEAEAAEQVLSPAFPDVDEDLFPQRAAYLRGA